jgi:hypothetical protein
MFVGYGGWPWVLPRMSKTEGSAVKSYKVAYMYLSLVRSKSMLIERVKYITEPGRFFRYVIVFGSHSLAYISGYIIPLYCTVVNQKVYLTTRT